MIKATSYCAVLTALFFLATFSVQGKTLLVPVIPAGDGMVIDEDKDGLADKILATEHDGDAREIKCGSIWKKNFNAVFEFKLPELKEKIKSAKLILYLNGKYGTYPDKADNPGPETGIFYYFPPEANGAVELTDDGVGEKLPVEIKADKAGKKIIIDVSTALSEAQKNKHVFVAFRLVPTGKEKKETSWRIRSSEFAAKYSQKQSPVLQLETE